MTTYLIQQDVCHDKWITIAECDFQPDAIDIVDAMHEHFRNSKFRYIEEGEE